MHAAGESSGIEQFRFRRPPFFTLLIVSMLAAAPVGMLAPWLMNTLSGRPWLPGLLFIIAVTAGFSGALLGIRALVRPKVAPAVKLDTEEAVLPVSSGSRRSRPVRYEDITSLNVFGKGRWARLLIATKGRNFVYPVAHFDGGAVTLDAFRGALRERIAARPGGAELLRGIEARDARGSSLVQRPSRVTLVLLVLLAAIFAWTWLSGALDDPFGLVAFGANAPLLVESGEWYRLLSANFLHAGWLHLYMNGIGVFLLGTLLERLVGPWRFVLIFLSSAAAGAAASLLVSDAALSVGASTAVFGLLGAFAFLNWRHRTTLPGGFSQPLRTWAILLGINAALPFIVPIIDWAAHVGGFVAGAAVAAVLSPGTDAGRLGHAAAPGLKAATIGVVALYVAALGHAFVGAFDETHAATLRVANAFVDRESTRPSALNSIAWQYAIKPGAVAAELDVAERAALQAIEVAPRNSAFLDTLATVHYRLGRFDQAVATQRLALSIDERPVLISQMGRFLDAYAARHGPYTLGDFDSDRIDIRIDVRGDARGDVRVDASGSEKDLALIVELPTAIDRGLEVYALDKRAGRILGVVRLLVGAGLPAGRHRIPLNEWRGPLDAQPYAVVYADASDCDCPSRGIRYRYLPLRREVQKLPGPL